MKKKKNKKLLICILLIVFFVSLVGLSFLDYYRRCASYHDINGKESFNIGETFENKYIRIKVNNVVRGFTNLEDYKIREGYETYLVYLTFENIDKYDQYISSYDFEAYADDVLLNQRYGDEYYPSLDVSFSKGKKANGYILFDAPIDSDNIYLELNTYYLDQSKVKFIIK